MKNDYSSYQKNMEIPGVIIYKNMFYDPSIIELLEDKNKTSLLSEWKSWYELGEIKYANIDQNMLHIFDIDNEKIIKEKIIFKKMLDIINFVKNDYLKFYKNSDIWPKYIKDWKQFDVQITNNDFTVLKYIHNSGRNISNPENGYMSMEYHIDQPDILEDSALMNKLALTVTFYLNDDYDGGHITFYNEKEKRAYKYKVSAGDVVVFPSAIPFWHGVEPFFNADRYLIRTFVKYRPDGSEEWNKRFKELGREVIEREEQEIIQNWKKTPNYNIALVFPGQTFINEDFRSIIYLDEPIIEIK